MSYRSSNKMMILIKHLDIELKFNQTSSTSFAIDEWVKGCLENRFHSSTLVNLNVLFFDLYTTFV